MVGALEAGQRHDHDTGRPHEVVHEALVRLHAFHHSLYSRPDAGVGDIQDLIVTKDAVLEHHREIERPARLVQDDVLAALEGRYHLISPLGEHLLSRGQVVRVPVVAHHEMLIFVLSLLTACGDEEPLAPDTEDPEVTENVGTFEPMSTGSSHTCGINTDHILYCWGCSHWGQLGGSREPPPDAHPSKAGSPSPR